MYTIEFSTVAKENIQLIKNKYPPKVYDKLIELLKELSIHPRTGKGKPELLKGTNGRWSRRLTKKDRIEYYIYDKVVQVYVVKCLGHYTDK